MLAHAGGRLLAAIGMYQPPTATGGLAEGAPAASPSERHCGPSRAQERRVHLC